MTTSARTRRHVLVVDDSGPARLLIRQALERWARRTGQLLEVVEAENGFEALRELPRTRFDLVLTDVNMPTLSGLELIRMIRSRPEQGRLPVVAVSTERDTEDAARARKAGADGYLGKPFDAETFDRVLDEVLASRPQGEP